jgi:uncharacterized repeat protein (TIGR03803 family)
MRFSIYSEAERWSVCIESLFVGGNFVSRWTLSKIVGFVFVFCLAATIASPAQVFAGLVNFNGPQGADPEAPLIRGTDGNFYGTTYTGGTGTNCGVLTPGCGTIFKLTPTGKLQVIYNFCHWN